MGSGTSTLVVVGPPPKGVVAREHESWPVILRALLQKTPAQLRELSERAHRASARYSQSFFPNPEELSKLEEAGVVYDFALHAVVQMRETQTSLPPK